MVQRIFPVGFLLWSMLSASAALSAPSWGWWDRLKVAWCHERFDTASGWSKSQVIFRASDGKSYHENPLANVNAGNFHAQLAYLQGLQSRVDKLPEHSPVCYTTLSAYRVEFNTAATSEYYHCQVGKCEFRLSGSPQLAITPLAEIVPNYVRVGIKNQLQIPQCSIGRDSLYAGPLDICTPQERGSQKITSCAEPSPHAHACYFAFPVAGLNRSYRIIKTAQAPLDWHKNISEQLEQLARQLQP